VCVGGKIDGIRDGRLIEIKNRKMKFMSPLPEYDIIQLHCYMFMLKRTEGDLIEHLPNEKQKITVVKWNKTLWSTVYQNLIHFARVFHQLIHRFEWQKSLLSCKTQNEQRALFFQFYQQVSVCITINDDCL
jgi:hypothetical protein